jgi:hypothetical protein
LGIKDIFNDSGNGFIGNLNYSGGEKIIIEEIFYNYGELL